VFLFDRYKNKAAEVANSKGTVPKKRGVFPTFGFPGPVKSKEGLIFPSSKKAYFGFIKNSITKPGTKVIRNRRKGVLKPIADMMSMMKSMSECFLLLLLVVVVCD